MLFHRKAAPRVFTSPSGERHRLYADMLRQPHLLVAGATGSGKSVVINGLIYTALYNHPTNGAGGALFVLIDPKRVELSMYRDLPHTLYYASEPDTMRQALYAVMAFCESRYKQMQRDGVRLYQGGDVYVIIDEFADLMTTQKRLILPVIQRLAQIGRAAKIHLVIATQTPIARVLPTEVKCNFDSRVALRTRSAQDSRNILGVKGCEKLPRYGAAYYMTPDRFGVECIPMIPDNEITARIEWWTSQLERSKRR